MASVTHEVLEPVESNQPPRALLVLMALLASVAAAVAGERFGFLIVMSALALMSVLVMVFVRAEVATLFVIFVLYSNLSVILVRRGVPSSAAGSLFLLLLLPLLNYVVVKRQPLVMPPIFIMMIGYLGILLLSMAQADEPERSFSRVFSYVTEGMALYLLIVNTVRTPALLRKAIWAVLAAGIAMGSVTLYQGMTGSYDNDFGGWAQVTESETSVGEEDFVGNQPMAPRLAGPVGEKNRFAQILVVLLPLAIGRVRAEKSFKLRALAMFSIIPIVGGALLTFSRGAGFALVILLFALMAVRMVPIRYVIVLVALVAFVVFVLVPGYLYRIANLDIGGILQGDVQEADTSVQGRLTQYIAATYMIRDNPVLGVGPGQASHFITHYARGIGYKVLDENRRTHDMYLEEAADTGLLGLFSLLGIIGVTLVRLVMFRAGARQKAPEMFFTASSLILSIVAYLSTAVFLHLAYVRYFWFLMALAGAAIAIWSAEVRDRPPERHPLTRRTVPAFENAEPAARTF